MAERKPAESMAAATPNEPGRHEVALAAIDASIGRLGDNNDPGSARELARALMSRAILAARLGRGAEEMASCDDLIRRFTMSGDADVVALVAMAHNRRGRALVVADRLNDALTAFDLAWAISTGWKEPALVRQAAAALYATGTLRKKLGQTGEAISAWNDMVVQYADCDDIEVAQKMVAADQARAGLLRASERGNEAARVYAHLMDRVARRPEPAFVKAYGDAALMRADCLIASEYHKGAVECCEDAIAFLTTAGEQDVAAPLWAELVLVRARALRALGRSDDAAAGLAEIDRLFRDSRDAALSEKVAQALVELAELKAAGSDFEKAGKICDLIVRRYAASGNEDLQQLVQRAQSLAARATAGIGPVDGALGALNDLALDHAPSDDEVALEPA